MANAKEKNINKAKKVVIEAKTAVDGLLEVGNTVIVIGAGDYSAAFQEAMDNISGDLKGTVYGHAFVAKMVITMGVIGFALGNIWARMQLKRLHMMGKLETIMNRTFLVTT